VIKKIELFKDKEEAAGWKKDGGYLFWELFSCWEF